MNTLFEILFSNHNKRVHDSKNQYTGVMLGLQARAMALERSSRELREEVDSIVAQLHQGKKMKKRTRQRVV